MWPSESTCGLSSARTYMRVTSAGVAPLANSLACTLAMA